MTVVRVRLPTEQDSVRPQVSDHLARIETAELGRVLPVELGELYYNRMLRFVGIKQYEAQLSKVLEVSSASAEQEMLTSV